MYSVRAKLYDLVLCGLFVCVVVSLVTSLSPMAPIAIVSVTMLLTLVVSVMKKRGPLSRERCEETRDDILSGV